MLLIQKKNIEPYSSIPLAGAQAAAHGCSKGLGDGLTQLPPTRAEKTEKEKC